MTFKNLSQSKSPYTEENVHLCNLLYGKNLISLGGEKAIDELFSDVSINGCNAIDIGFGHGGVDIYLAEKYAMQILGIEVNDWMVTHARCETPKHLRQNLHFSTYEKIPKTTKHFDIAFSKGVLNHVTDKLPLFSLIKKMIKPNGRFIIADWISPEKKVHSDFGLIDETKSSYIDTLTQSGFTVTLFEDTSNQFLEHVSNFQKNLQEKKEEIVTHYNNALFETISKQHSELAEKLQTKKKCAVRIIAESS